MKLLCGFIIALLAASAFGQDRVSLLKEDFEGTSYGWTGAAWGNGAQTLLAPGQCGSQTRSIAFILPSTCNYSTGSPGFRSVGSPRFTAFTTSIWVEFDYVLSMDPTGDDANVGLVEYTTMGGGSSVPVADMSALMNDGKPHHATFSVSLPAAGTQWYVWFGVTADGIGDLLPGWRIDNVVVSEFSAVQSFCFGDQSGAKCPCTNSYIPAGGCSNSLGMGALLTATGSLSVASDDLILRAQQMPWGTQGMLIEGSLATASGVPFLDGLLCLGAPMSRLQPGTNFGSGIMTFGPGIASAAQWSAGTTHFVQVWYRDGSSYCGHGSNTTQALSLVLGP